MRGTLPILAFYVMSSQTGMANALDDLAIESASCIAFAQTMTAAALVYSGPPSKEAAERDRVMFAELAVKTRGTATEAEFAREVERAKPMLLPGALAFYANAATIPGSTEDPLSFVSNRYAACNALLDRVGIKRSSP